MRKIQQYSIPIGVWIVLGLLFLVAIVGIILFFVFHNGSASPSPSPSTPSSLTPSPSTPSSSPPSPSSPPPSPGPSPSGPENNDDYLKATIDNRELFLSWSSGVKDLKDGRKWAIWQPKKETKIQITDDDYLKATIDNRVLFLSWSSGFGKDLSDHRKWATWSPTKDTKIQKEN